MDQYQLLWNYQQADVEVDKMENAMRRSPTRIKLQRTIDSLKEQQAAIRRIEDEVSVMSDRLEALKDAVSRTEDQLKTLQSKMENEPAVASEEAQQFIADVKRMLSNLNSYEQEIKHIRKDASDRERQQHDVKIRAAKFKAEYDKLREAFDAENKVQAAELEKVRAAAAEKAAEIAPEYMERYKNIKQHSVPPLARLVGDQCGGCNMSMPSVVARNIKAGKPVECETCGRLIVNLQ